jgi:uncharacterized protein YutE (UPF0331/DUF86 family)
VIDRDLVAKKLAFIETCVRELRELSRTEALRTDVKEERFVEHTLQIAVQAALGVVEDVVGNRLEDLLAFVGVVRQLQGRAG